MQRLTLLLSYHFHPHNTFRHCFLYSSSSTPTLTDSFANYLVDSLGFSHQQALSASSKLSKYRKVNDFNFDANATSVVTFLRHYGFSDTHIRNIVSRNPRLLCSNVDNTIQPKLQFLHDQGFSWSDIVPVIASNPQLLLAALDSALLPVLQVLKRLFISDAHVISVLGKFGPRNFSGVFKHLLPNVDLLTSYGIPVETIRNHIVRHPGTFLRNPEKFKEIVIRVEKKLGIARDAPMFLYGVHLLFGFSEESIESKCRMFKSFGWTQSDVDAFLMKNASCFTFSDATIKKKLDFLMNELRLKPAYLTSNPVFLTCSLEKRVVPRHTVLLILKERGLLDKNPSLSRAIRMSESTFLAMFVIPFKEVHEVYAKLTGCSMKLLTRERPDDLQSSTSSLQGRCKAYSTSAFSTDSFANYLVDSLGFSHQQALSTSTRVSKYRKVNDFNFDANANSVVTFFRTYGFNDTHLNNMVLKYPRILTCNVDNTLKPKLKFLQEHGFSGSDLIQVISANPNLLLAGLESCISPALLVFRKLLLSDAHVIVVLRKLGSRNFTAVVRFLIPNVDFLTSYGIPIESIRKHIIRNPTTFLRNPEKLKEIVIRFENKLEIARDVPMFLYGVHLFSGYSEENIESKCRLFKSFGWTQSDVKTLVMQNACCFHLSEESIKQKLDFLMNKLQLEPAYLIAHTKLLSCSLEKNIVPRHEALRILKGRGLLEKFPSFCHVVCLSEPCFLKRFVIPFKEVHQVYAKRTGCSMSMLTQENADNIS